MPDDVSPDATITVSFARSPLRLEFEDEDFEPTARQVAVVDLVRNLPASLIDRIAAASTEYYEDHAEWAVECGAVIDEHRLADHIRFGSVTVPTLGRSPHSYWFLTGDCDWEPEHGIEVMLDGAEVRSVGPVECEYLTQRWQDRIVEESRAVPATPAESGAELAWRAHVDEVASNRVLPISHLRFDAATPDATACGVTGVGWSRLDGWHPESRRCPECVAVAVAAGLDLSITEQDAIPFGIYGSRRTS